MKLPIAACCSLLALAACAHNPPPPPPVPPPAVPRAAVDMMCSRMHAEGMSTELRALKMTQPLITPQSVQALAQAMMYSGRAAPQIAAAASVPVETSGSCVKHPIDAMTTHASDGMTVAFSSPFPDAFVKGQRGGHARCCLRSHPYACCWIPRGQL